MEIITDIKEANNLLQSYRDATLQISIYSASLRRIALKLSLSKDKEVLYLIGISCESLNGRFSYKNSNLSIEIISENDEPKTIIEDKFASFKLVVSGGFSLAKGNETEFGTSFDDFLLDKGNE